VIRTLLLYIGGPLTPPLHLFDWEGTITISQPIAIARSLPN